MAGANSTASNDVSALRICRTCNIEQPLSNFYFTRQYPWKDCKACESIKTAAKRKSDNENFRAKARARDAKLRLKRTELTQEELKRRVSYDPETGLFSRLVFEGNSRDTDKIGGLNADGYLVLRVAGEKYMAHRLAWLYVYGRWPDGELDHISRIRDDNRICNLREVSRSGNVQNIGSLSKNNKSGFLGVSVRGSKWVATIAVNGTKLYLGCFADPAEAHQVYLEAKRKYHPTFTL